MKNENTNKSSKVNKEKEESTMKNTDKNKEKKNAMEKIVRRKLIVEKKTDVVRPEIPKATVRILAKDCFIDNDTRKTGLSNHDIIVGASGTGKTGGYVIPNLLTTDGSMVVVDTKGQLYRRYHTYLEKKGFRTGKLDFVKPEESGIYNMLDYIRPSRVRGDEDTGDPEYRTQDVKVIARALLPDSIEKNDAFWLESARDVMVSLIAYVMEKVCEEERNMCSVAKLYRSMRVELSEKGYIKGASISFFENLRAENPNSFAVQMYDLYRGSFSAEKMWGSIAQFVTNALEPFFYAESRMMFSGKSTIHFADLGKEKSILFVIVSDMEKTMDSMLGIFYSQMIRTLVESADARDNAMLEVPVRIILDDFAAGFTIPDFDEFISVIRSRGVSVSLIVQDIAQLEKMYTKAQAQTILSNCGCKVFIGGQDERTSEYLGKMIGCLPEKFTKMNDNEAVVLIRGRDEIYTEKIEPYAMDRELGL